MGEGDRPAVLLSSAEPPSDADGAVPGAGRWRMESGIAFIDIPESATHVFIVADGASDPVDQLEALKEWLATATAELARVLCVVHCQLLEANPRLFPWYEACIHFSDVVLLNRREGVANKWVSDFQGRFEEKFYPCLFELVRGSGLKNPALVLAPQARRMSHAFDEPEWVAEGDEEGEEQEDGEEVEVKQEIDPYFERRNGGRRVTELPRIAGFLGGSSS